MTLFQTQLPALDERLLKWLHRNRTGLRADMLTAKLARDFKVPELDAMCTAHLPWRPQAIGTKATKAAELSAWLFDNLAAYLEQQGQHLGQRGRQRRFYMMQFW
jgi:hypothetical protein